MNWKSATKTLGDIRWVITSPPYYGLRTYRADQWLREWFVGGPPEVNYDANRQVRHSSPEDFATDLSSVWRTVAEVSAPDARLVFRFGAINDRPICPREVARASIKGTPWKVDGIRSAGLSTLGRRQAKSFTDAPSDPVAEIDVWCSLR